jgi:integrase
MKHPNGYGSILKLSGKRRKPFAVRITAGWEIKNGKAKQKFKYLGYYESRPEAMIALAEYNKSPYDIDNNKITFEEVFEMWKKEKYTKMSESNIRGYNAAYGLSVMLHSLPFKAIRKSHMQSVMDNTNKSHSTKKRLKTFFSQIYKFALENDIVEKDYSQFVEIGKNNTESKRKPFSDVEIKKLWDNLRTKENADMALIMIYTGLRPSELIAIKNKNIYLNERYLVAGLKTEAGKDRIIPINEKIHPLIENRMDQQHKYLFVNSLGNKMTYNSFRKDYWQPLMDELNLNHTAHECRHTFISLMDTAGANKVSIKKISGHATQDITEKVYTHKNISELIEAIDLI